MSIIALLIIVVCTTILLKDCKKPDKKKSVKQEEKSSYRSPVKYKWDKYYCDMSGEGKYAKYDVKR